MVRALTGIRPVPPAYTPSPPTQSLRSNNHAPFPPSQTPQVPVPPTQICSTTTSPIHSSTTQICASATQSHSPMDQIFTPSAQIHSSSSHTPSDFILSNLSSAQILSPTATHNISSNSSGQEEALDQSPSIRLPLPLLEMIADDHTSDSPTYVHISDPALPNKVSATSDISLISANTLSSMHLPDLSTLRQPSINAAELSMLHQHSNNAAELSTLHQHSNNAAELSTLHQHSNNAAELSTLHQHSINAAELSALHQHSNNAAELSRLHQHSINAAELSTLNQNYNNTTSSSTASRESSATSGLGLTVDPTSSPGSLLPLENVIDELTSDVINELTSDVIDELTSDVIKEWNTSPEFDMVDGQLAAGLPDLNVLLAPSVSPSLPSASSSSAIPTLVEEFQTRNPPKNHQRKIKELLTVEGLSAKMNLIKLGDLKHIVRELVLDNERLKTVLSKTNIYLEKQANLISVWTNRFAKSEKKEGKGDNKLALHNLSTQLDVAEEAQTQLSQDLQRVTGEKLELANHVSSLQLELEQARLKLDQQGRESTERLQQEKWELAAVNTDLQQRLQQTVALAHMQAEGSESRLQEELGTMLVQLEEERQVTARLSKSLELERRKLESLEQKAKGSVGKKDGSRRRSSLLPEDIREGESRLASSMELYRQRCDNLGASLASCQQHLERENWHPDLATEISKLRKLLSEERRGCVLEGEKLQDVHQLFQQVYHDYSSVLESMKQSQQEKKLKKENVLENIKESNIRDNMDSLTARLMNAEDSLNRERAKTLQLQERLADAEMKAESIPLLQAQVEVYQGDFNAEREARERIAGEKADLLEQISILNKQTGGRVQQHQQPPTRAEPAFHPAPVDDRHRFQAEDPPRRAPGRLNQLDVGRFNQEDQHGHHGMMNGGRRVEDRTGGRLELGVGGGRVDQLRDRMHEMAEEEQHRLPLTLPARQQNNRAVQEDERVGELSCPKCGRDFRNTTLLTRHVNDCLDRDF